MKISLSFLFPLILFFFAGCATQSNDLVSCNDDPFYQQEKENGTYGKKTSLDRTLQFDPKQGKLRCSPSFFEDPPKRIAVLPFENLEGGNFKLNWVPVTGRDGEEENNWSWTYANRLRKSFFAYMSLREFELLSLIETDTVLQELGITNAEKLYNADPRDLAAALGVDAVMYGKMTNHSAKYLLLYTQVAVGLSVKCVSGKDGSEFFLAKEVRRDNKFSMAFSPIDLVAASVQNTFNVRKLHMARAADEACRELVSGIPIVDKLIKEKESYCKEYVASNKDIQAIKRKMAVTNGGEVDLLTNGGIEVVKAEDLVVGTDEEFLAGTTNGRQLAYADGVIRASESTSELTPKLSKGVLSEAKESGDGKVVAAVDLDNFNYTVSVPDLRVDESSPRATPEEATEIVRADVLYSSAGKNADNPRDEVLEIEASDIIYSNTGVVADSPADVTNSQDEADSREMEKAMDEIIEMSVSDIIYSSTEDPLLPNSTS